MKASPNPAADSMYIKSDDAVHELTGVFAGLGKGACVSPRMASVANSVARRFGRPDGSLSQVPFTPTHSRLLHRTSACPNISIMLRPATAMILGVLLSGCVVGSAELPFATTILDFAAEPNPASVGDTVRLFVVVSDSLDSDLSFQWSDPSPSVFAVTTLEPERTWVATEEGEYQFYIVVSRPGAYLNIEANMSLVVDRTVLRGARLDAR